MHVYVVTIGEYSDKYVDAVFSGKEKAETYARHCRGHVEEHELDSPEAVPHAAVAGVRGNIDTRGIETLFGGTAEESAAWKDDVPMTWVGSPGDTISARRSTCFVYVLSSVSLEQATKACAERLQKWAAQMAECTHSRGAVRIASQGGRGIATRCIFCKKILTEGDSP